MRVSKRRFLKNVLVIIISGTFILLFRVSSLIAQTSEKIEILSKPDTTHDGSLTVNLTNRFDSLYVIVNKNFNKTFFIKNNGTIYLPEGKYLITLATRYVQDISIPVKIISGQHITVHLPVIFQYNRKKYQENSSYTALREGSNVEILTDVDSQVAINDSTYGYGAMRLRLRPGKYRVITRQPDGRHSIKWIVVKKNLLRFFKLRMFNKPDVRVIREVSIIPGGGQLFKNEWEKGGALLAGFTVGIIAGLHYNKIFEGRKVTYDASYQKYQNSTTESGALQLGNQTEELYNRAKQAQRIRNIIVGSVAAIYLYSFLDSWLNIPPGGYRDTDNRRSHLQAYLGPQNAGLQFKIQF